ncbi:unnamed protein product, partial [Mesorhabditis belari]|uniref:Zinc knuckle CX2CX3GHX4C domain-containing protein n=1 Tax=Mesorhabditis belari TaxID=2138241 RepID=A0AAF3ERD7_9BILA
MGAENPIALMLSKLAVSDEPSTSCNPYGPIGRPRVTSNASQSDCLRNTSFRTSSTSTGISSGRSSSLLPTPPPSPPNVFFLGNSQMMSSSPQSYSPFHSSSNNTPFSAAGFRMYSPNSAFTSPIQTPFGTPPYSQSFHQVFRQPHQIIQQQPVQQTDEDIEAEVLRELQALRSTVPDDYVCHRCNQKGHWIKFCPTKNPMNERTPYQGDRPSVGFFRCGCTRQWKADAQKNTPMTCRGCRQPVFPFKMMKKSG